MTEIARDLYFADFRNLRNQLSCSFVATCTNLGVFGQISIRIIKLLNSLMNGFRRPCKLQLFYGSKKSIVTPRVIYFTSLSFFVKAPVAYFFTHIGHLVYGFYCFLYIVSCLSVHARGLQLRVLTEQLLRSRRGQKLNLQ